MTKKGNSMDFDDFLHRENLDRYRRILDESIADPKRQTILKLQAEETAKPKLNSATKQGISG